jgi:hypothetical protein
VSTRRIDRAIRAAREFLLVRGMEQGWQLGPAGQSPQLLPARCLRAISDEPPVQAADFLDAAIEKLCRAERQSVDFRASRLLALARQAPRERRETIAADAAWLIAQQGPDGGWGLGTGHPAFPANPGWTDTERTALALGGLHRAGRMGIDVPRQVWTRAAVWLLEAANADGGYGLQGPTEGPLRVMGGSYGSATAAAAEALCLVEPHLPGALQERHGATLAAALRWLSARAEAAGHPGYVWQADPVGRMAWRRNLARLAGRTHLPDQNGRDWAGRLARAVLADQAADGSFPDDSEDPDPQATLRRTVLAVEALLEARRPIALCWLGPDAMPPPALRRLTDQLSSSDRGPVRIVYHDLASLPATLSRSRLVIVDLPRALPAQPQPQAAAMRTFLQNDGLALVLLGRQAELAGQARDRWTQLAQALQLSVEPMGPEHPVRKMQPPLGPVPAIRATLLNGRLATAAVLLETDLAEALCSPDPQVRLSAGRFVDHLLTYAGGPGPLVRPEIPAPGQLPPPVGSITVARLEHAGGWDVRPEALKHLVAPLARSASLQLQLLDPVDLTGPADPNVLWITGTAEAKLTAAQLAACKKYVAAGGTIFADAAGGGQAFYDVMTRQLTEAFGLGSLRRIGQDHPLVRGSFGGGMGADVRQVGYSPAVRRNSPKLDKPVLMGIEIDGRLAVICSPIGVTGALEGRTFYGAALYKTAAARRLACNVLLYAWAQRDR